MALFGLFRKLGLSLGLLALLLLEAGPVRGQALPRAERIAFAAYRNGQWDLFSIRPDGSTPKQLTRDPYEDTDPVYAPAGDKLAYASRRNNNWDVYILDLHSGQESRLTDSPHYDGAPSWSPDGQFLAYESYQNGDLDVWLVDAAGREPATNLTAESLAGDFAPAWSPDGQSIIFTSWRQTEAEVQERQVANRNLFLLSLESGEVARLTGTPTAEYGATWHPDGQKVAFSHDAVGDVEIYSLALTGEPPGPARVEPITWLGRTDGPAWSPDGRQLAAILHRWDGQRITLTQVGQPPQLPAHLTPVISIQGRLTWHDQAIDFGMGLPNLLDPGQSSLYQEQIGVKTGTFSTATGMVRLNDIEVGTPWLADTVDDSFLAWRFRLRDELGYDFLSRLSDASRDVAAYTDTSQYASWHKSGRAIDTLFDHHLNGQLAFEIVREDISGDTFWRVFLRCADQSGRCGRPLVANPWNYSARVRTLVAPEQGGIEKGNLSGYYVDVTARAREYGWERISAYKDAEFSWEWHFIAFEYWHFQKRLDGIGRHDDANWYQAMLDIYPPETVARFFNWERMREIGDDPYLIALKGVPLPLEQQPWWVLVEQ
jgi:TolB protein